jgi:WD40 repeat protein
MWARRSTLTAFVPLALGLLILQTDLALPQAPPERAKAPDTALGAPEAKQGSELEADLYRPDARDLHGDPLPPHAIARLGTLRLRHDGEVGSVAVSPDGKMVVSATGISGARVWDTSTGRELDRFRGKIRAGFVTFSADGRTFLAMWGDDTFQQFDIATGQLKREAKLGERLFSANAVHFSADRSLVLFTDRTYHFGIWEVDSGKLRFHVHLPTSKGSLPLAFSPDGNTVATHDDTGTFRLWDGATGKELTRLQGQEDWGTPMGFSPDSKNLVTVKGTTLSFWDVKNKKQLQQIPGGGWPIAFSPDGNTLAFGSGNAICLYDLARGRELCRCEGHQDWRVGGNLAVIFSPDGKVLASGGGDHTVILWDAATGKPLHPFDGHRGTVNSLAFAPDGKSLASGGNEDGTLLVWDLATSKVLSRHPKHRQAVLSVAYSPDGKIIATGDGTRNAGGNPMKIRLWDVAGGQLLREFDAHRNGVYCLAFSANGKLLASGGGDDTAKLWETATGKEVQQFVMDSRSDQVYLLALSPDSKTLVLMSQKGGLQLCDVDRGKVLGGLDSRQRNIRLVRFSADGRTLVTVGTNFQQALTADVWDVKTWKVTREVEISADRVWVGDGLALSPDAKTLAVPSRDHSVCVWDLDAGKELFRFSGHAGRISSLAFSPDGRRLASGSEDTTVLLWDLVRARQTSLWSKLGSETDADPVLAVQALVATPEETIPYLKERLSWHATQEARVRRLLERLDDDKFEVRAKALAELRSIGQTAAFALERALEEDLSAEAQRRVRDLLDDLKKAPPVSPAELNPKPTKGPPPPPKNEPPPESATTRERRAVLRAFAVLEEINTPAARQVVEALARADAKGWVTHQAELSWGRLSRRSPNRP